jgi:hypothetical protein
MRYARLTMAAVLLAAVVPALAVGENAAPAVLLGAVKHELVLDEALLKSLPAVSIDVGFATSQGRKSGSYTGVPLWALLGNAELIDAPGKNAGLRHTLLITGRDGYAAALALGEIDPALRGQAGDPRLFWRRTASIVRLASPRRAR